ncbi:MAG: protein kinase [Deltaproteobacteria bacterium]|nr:protein kinase [Deltaproteobacteria bacterium]
MLQAGDRVYQYVVEERVGGGGAATVFRVRHQVLGHALALKVLDPRLAADPRQSRRFLLEGRIMARIRHPAIVMVTDALVEPALGVLALVMEYVEGPNLGEVLASFGGPAPTAALGQLFLPVLAGIHHAHREGVVHRDLKPGNVLVSRDASGRWLPRIADFGVAHTADRALLGDLPVRETRSGVLLGTPAFMCPEQIRGDAPAPAWDQFALGAMLFEAATGRHPFEGPSDDATLAAISERPPPPPSAVAPTLSRDLERVILTALATDPGARFPSCEAMATALAAALAAQPSDPPRAAAQVARASLSMGRGGGSRWELTASPVRIGSGEGDDVVLPARLGVTAGQATLRFADQAWVVEGEVWVNGARAAHQQVASGDIVRVGHAVLRFEVEGARPEARRQLWLLEEGSDRRWALGLRGLLIGTAPHADLRPADQTLPPRLATVRPQGRDVIVESHSPSHLPQVNGRRATFRLLRPGDALEVGGIHLKLAWSQ